MSFTESLADLVARNPNGLLSAHPTWGRVPLGLVFDVQNGFPFESKHFNDSGDGVPLLRIRDVVRGSTETYYSGEYDPAFVVSSGEIVVGMDGDFNCRVWQGAPALLNQRVCCLRPRSDCYSNSLLRQVLQGYLDAINAKTSAITVKHLSSETIKQVPLPLPPREEQQRIVEAIDSYLTQLDDAVASLERVQTNLKAYRASVLKAAVEGRLVPTEASVARAAKHDYESAQVLLARILKERRRRWEEAELANLRAAGPTPKDDRWKAKYREPVAPDISTLPELSEGWCWVCVDQLGLVSGGLTQNAKREKYKTKLPFLRVANVYANALVLDEIRTIGVEPREIERARLSPGDLLVVEGNGSVDQIGRVALWDGSIEPILHQNHLIKVRCEPCQLSKWTLAWLLSPAGRAAIEHVASSTSGLHTLSISKVGRLVVPLPPLAEQTRASDEVDAKLSLADALVHSVSHDLRRCSRLRQSVLKWAFEGKLVDQVSTDEPAEKLLARIRAGRAAAAPIKKRRRGVAKVKV